LVFLAQPLRQQAPDAEAQERVGEEIAFEEGVNHGNFLAADMHR
jgi:hypothetical protein